MWRPELGHSGELVRFDIDTFVTGRPQGGGLLQSLGVRRRDGSAGWRLAHRRDREGVDRAEVGEK